jgi:hypothetical protein
MTSRSSQKQVKTNTNLWTVTYIDEDNNECIGIWESSSQQQLRKDLKLQNILDIHQSTEEEIKEVMIDDEQLTGNSAESRLEEEQRLRSAKNFAAKLLSGRVSMAKDPIDEMLERQVGNITTTIDGQEVTVSATQPKQQYIQQPQPTSNIQVQQVQPVQVNTPVIEERIVELSSGEIIKIASDGTIYERVWKDIDISKTANIRVINPKNNSILVELPKTIKIQQIEWVKKA